jgi:hypothetical protein
MKTLIRLEELAKVVLAYLLSMQLGFSWWVFPALLLLPDLGMLGYSINTRVGAVLYNLAHHQGLAIAADNPFPLLIINCT